MTTMIVAVFLDPLDTVGTVTATSAAGARVTRGGCRGISTWGVGALYALLRDVHEHGHRYGRRDGGPRAARAHPKT
jgi:hypothetical protein